MTTDITTSDDYYEKLRQYFLREDQLEEIGYPIVSTLSTENMKIPKINETYSLAGADITNQKCRCQKRVNLLEYNWFVGPCFYHPQKVDRNNGFRHKCCGRKAYSLGCRMSQYHICPYIPYYGAWIEFIKKEIPYPYCNVYGLDCEFVYTIVGMQVARVSLVSLEYGVVYDQHVRVEKHVLDYDTEHSGVTHEDLKGDVKSLYDVHWDLYTILNADSILVGHGLHSDLRGLKLFHYRILDTSIIFPHIGGFPYRYSLQYLAKKYLNIDIHNDPSGHCSVEDAKICLQLVAHKCELFDLQERIRNY